MIVNPKNFKHVKSRNNKPVEAEESWPMQIVPQVFLLGLTCDCCNEKEDIVYDEVHGELICNKCGCVIMDNFFI